MNRKQHHDEKQSFPTATDEMTDEAEDSARDVTPGGRREDGPPGATGDALTPNRAAQESAEAD